MHVPGADSSAGRWVVRWRVALVTLVIGVVIVALGTAAAAEVYDQITEEHNGVAAFDRPALDWAVAHRPGWLTDTATAVTHTGGGIGLPILGAIAGLAFWWFRRSWTPFLIIIATGTGSLVMTMVGKAVIVRARPPLAEAVPPYEHSPAFPSGHTLNSTALALVVGYLVLLGADRHRERVLTVVAAVAFPLVIGLTRVYLGHHWLTDVVAGWALGAAWAAIVITAHRLYLTVAHSRRGNGGTADPPAEPVPERRTPP